MLDFMFATPKRHIFWRNRVFWRILCQNPSRAIGCSELQEPKKNQKTNTFWCEKSRMRGNKTPGRIVTNFCTDVGVHDVITCADFYYDRWRGLGVAGGQIWAFSIDLFRIPYNTLALPCECVINLGDYNKSTNIRCQQTNRLQLFACCDHYRFIVSITSSQCPHVRDTGKHKMS